MSSSLSYRVRHISIGGMKLIKKISEKIKTNFTVPHPTLVAVAMGVGISMLAVLILTAIDGGLLGQQAEAYIPRRVKEHDM
jgi:hypothetical protein